ncbi:hypothetical protein GPECTOR_15g336 [Gonium pectorale]|uniref:Protein kinase domain-containing protein n=1 Tax=Gonium pectorale TaxID=33097 RepID=A0A150GLG6_GONPE|nr:hypothetical protein GPECTOR_15g336 [Gonium pectorale]|eukprot:KXZ50652.1 hypothetical protein GPECTOR_15g336 [Gonium pectorale]
MGSTVSVSNADAFVSALLNQTVGTIRVVNDVIMNSTRVRAQIRQALNDSEEVELSRSVSNRSSLALLDFGMATRFIYLGEADVLEFRALHIRGMYQLLDEVPSILTEDSTGTVRFSSVVSQRTACLPPSQQLQKIVDAARASGGGMSNDAALIGTAPANDEPAFAPSPDASATSNSDLPYDFGSTTAPVLDSELCLPLSGSDADTLGTDLCYESPLWLQDYSFTVTSAKRNPEESGLVAPSKPDGSDFGPAFTSGLRISFNMTIVVCDVFVDDKCADQTGDELAACIQELLDRKMARPPPSPLLPSRAPSPPPIPASPPPAILTRSDSKTVPLTVTLLPALLGSLGLAAVVLGGIVLCRRYQRQRGDPGAACFGKLAQQDSEGIPELEAGRGGEGGDGASRGAGAAAGGGGMGEALDDSRSNKGKGRASPSTGSQYGKYGKRAAGGDVPYAGGSAAGTMSSQGLSSTTTGLTMATTPGVTPPDSGNTDPTKAITLHHMLGSGSFGRVYYGLWQSQIVAVKIIPHTSAANTKVQQEVALCIRFNHPNVVRSLHCVTFESNSPQHQLSQVESLRSTSTATASTQQGLNMETWIVLEYCNAGSLASHLSLKAAALDTAGPSGGAAGPESTASGAVAAQGSSLLATPNASLGQPAQQPRDAALTHMRGMLSVARDIACGMAYLHSLNVCHGDLKCENVLLTAKPDAAVSSQDEQQRPSASAAAGGLSAPAVPFVAKVADFGLSKTFSDVSTHMSTATVGTVTHMCPVLLLTGQMRPSCDVFSFGIMLWQIITGGTPFAGMRYAEIVYKVAVAGMRPEFPPHVPRRLVAIAEACWAADPNVRPTFEQLVTQLSELLEVADQLQAEQEGALLAARASAVRPEDVSVAAVTSEEDRLVVNQWAAAAAAALLE